MGFVMTLDVVTTNYETDELDALLVAQLPSLVESMEHTAFALVRAGHHSAAHAFFLAAAEAAKVARRDSISH